MDTWWICRKFLYPIGREAILVSMLMFCLRNPIFRFQNDRKIGADWTSQSSFSLYPCSSNEGFEYIFLQIRLDFYLCSAKRGINLSRMKNRSAEKTLFFVRISYNPLPHVVRKKTWKCVDEMPIRALFSLFRLLGFTGFDCQIVV